MPSRPWRLSETHLSKESAESGSMDVGTASVPDFQSPTRTLAETEAKNPDGYVALFFSNPRPARGQMCGVSSRSQ